MIVAQHESWLVIATGVEYCSEEEKEGKYSVKTELDNGSGNRWCVLTFQRPDLFVTFQGLLEEMDLR